jgi:hypothetical protein
MKVERFERNREAKHALMLSLAGAIAVISALSRPIPAGHPPYHSPCRDRRSLNSESPEGVDCSGLILRNGAPGYTTWRMDGRLKRIPIIRKHSLHA